MTRESAPKKAQTPTLFEPKAPIPSRIAAVAPKDENGKFDTTKIAEASDFTGIEEESGCKS